MPEAASGASAVGEGLRLGSGHRALLFLHGFNGLPGNLLPAAARLAAHGWTVWLPVLPGHGTTPQDFGAQTGRGWLEAAVAAWDRLAREHPRPAVAGLSMGGALALHVAAWRPVPAVAALAPALYLRAWRTRLLPLARVLNLWRGATGNDTKADVPAVKAYARYPLRATRALQEVMRRVRAELPAVRAPLLGIQADVDHVIPPSCLDYLMRRAGSAAKTAVRLHDSHHVLTMDQEHDRVADLMHEFFGRWCRSGG